MNNRQKGAVVEQQALDYLTKKGYELYPGTVEITDYYKKNRAGGAE